MKLRKDDPVYYKSEIRKLIKEAKENGVGTSIDYRVIKGIAI